MVSIIATPPLSMVRSYRQHLSRGDGGKNSVGKNKERRRRKKSDDPLETVSIYPRCDGRAEVTEQARRRTRHRVSSDQFLEAPKVCSSAACFNLANVKGSLRLHSRCEEVLPRGKAVIKTPTNDTTLLLGRTPRRSERRSNQYSSSRDQRDSFSKEADTTGESDKVGHGHRAAG
jgi:hypothetical protein